MNQRTITVVVTELAGHGYKLDVADSGVTKEPSHEHALISDALSKGGADAVGQSHRSQGA